MLLYSPDAPSLSAPVRPGATAPVTTALVTGGSGYFGTTLVEHLVESGCQVRILDLNEPVAPPPGVEFVRADIRDGRAVRLACEGVDHVFHTVAQQPLSKDPELMESVNVEGTRTLLRAATDAGVSKMIHVSSTSVYGRTVPRDESSPLNPAEAYGRAKARAEELCWKAAADGLDVTIIRPRTIMGHGRLGLFEILFDWISAGDPVFVFGKGDGAFQFVHAADLASACILAAERPGPTSYNVGAAEFGSIRQALEALAEHAGTGAPVLSLPATPARLGMGVLSRLGLAPFGRYHWLVYGKAQWFDITKTVDELGWKPEHSNESMLCEAYDWYLENRDQLQAEGRSRHQSATKQGALKAIRVVARAATARRRRLRRPLGERPT